MTVNALTGSDSQIVFFLGHMEPIVNGLAKGKSAFGSNKESTVVWCENV